MPCFDLFGEISDQEQQELLDRKKRIQKLHHERLQQLLSVHPSHRSMAENRSVFCQQKNNFLVPGVAHNLLDSEECNKILNICQKQQLEWTTGRHSAFATTDIPIRLNELSYLEPLITNRLMNRVAKHFGFKPEDLLFRDIFLVKYSADAQRGLDLHTDGCLFSLTLLISNPRDFDGGGTYFSSLDDVIYLNQGDCSYHDARVMHSGIEITRGERYVLVGFIDTADTIEKDKNTTLRN